MSSIVTFFKGGSKIRQELNSMKVDIARIDGGKSDGGTPIYPTLNSNLISAPGTGGILYKFVDKNTIRVTGRVNVASGKFAYGITDIFTFPLEISSRIDFGQSAPAVGESSSQTDTALEERSHVGVDGVLQVIGYKVNRWFIINQTIHLSPE